MESVIKNQIGNDLDYSKTYPNMIGAISPALQEIHIFLEPIVFTNKPETNLIDSDMLQKYKSVCDKYNDEHKNDPSFKPMKPCYLALDFRNHGEICVLQSARYILSNDTKYIVEECHRDAELYRKAGFNVIREKIEASVYGINGIPQTKEEMLKYPTKYFEFHIRVQKKGVDETEPVSDNEFAELKKVSDKYGKLFNIPIPLSYNKNKSIEGIYQRFLNLRFRNDGAVNVLANVNMVKDTINNDTNFKVIKIISEYVWYDSYPDLDKGWIDFDDTE